jgi:hypothetical protein
VRPLTRHRIPLRDPAVIWRALEDELVIVRPASGEIRVLNAVGAFVWRSIDGRLAIADLASRVSDSFAVSSKQAKVDVEAFVEELVAEGWLSMMSDLESS